MDLGARRSDPGVSVVCWASLAKRGIFGVVNRTFGCCRDPSSCQHLGPSFLLGSCSIMYLENTSKWAWQVFRFRLLFPSIRKHIHTRIHANKHKQISTYIQKDIHTHTHTYIYIHIHTYIDICIPMYIYMYMHMYTYMYMYTWLPTCLPTYQPTYLPTYLPTNKQTCMYIHTYTHRYVYMYMCMYVCVYVHVRRPTYPRYPWDILGCSWWGSGVEGAAVLLCAARPQDSMV